MQKHNRCPISAESVAISAPFRPVTAVCACRPAARTGVTLVEIMVAAGVLALLLLIGFKVFSGFSNSFQKGNWALSTQNKLRNALTFVREEMQKATAMTVVSLSGTNITEANYEFLLNSNDNLTGNAAIAKWAICLPYVASDPDSPGATFRCELSLSGGDLIYKKTLEDGSDPKNKEKLYSGYKVIDNVAEIKLALEAFDPDNNTAGSLVSMNVKVVHPDSNAHPDAHVTAQTGAKVEVTVKREL